MTVTLFMPSTLARPRRVSKRIDSRNDGATMVFMTTTYLDYDPELERADHEDRVAEARERAVQSYLTFFATMSVKDWTAMLSHYHTASGWADDEDFWDRVGNVMKEAVENGLGI